MPSDEKLFTTFEVADLLAVGSHTVVKWVRDGRLAAFRTPGGHRRIKEADLVSFLSASGMPIPEGLGHRTRVLLLVSDAELSAGLRKATRMNREAFEVEVFADPVLGLVRLGAWRPEVVVLDTRITSPESWTILARLKASPETRGIQVLMLSEETSPERVRRAESAGVRALLPLPVSPPDLLAQLRPAPVLATRLSG